MVPARVASFLRSSKRKIALAQQDRCSKWSELALPSPGSALRRGVSDPLTGGAGFPSAGRPLTCSHTPWNSQPGSRCSPPDPGFRFGGA